MTTPQSTPARASGQQPLAPARDKRGRFATPADTRGQHPARFWSKVRKGPGCWEWRAKSRTPNGYGVYSLGGKKYLAHRVAWELTHGPIPTGMQIDHVRARGCTSKLCCNPAHLEVVTNRENQLRGDGMGGRHARQTHCLRGHPFTPENTYRNPNKPHSRFCRTCRAMHRRRAYERGA